MNWRRGLRPKLYEIKQRHSSTEGSNRRSQEEGRGRGGKARRPGPTGSSQAGTRQLKQAWVDPPKVKVPIRVVSAPWSDRINSQASATQFSLVLDQQARVAAAKQPTVSVTSRPHQPKSKTRTKPESQPNSSNQPVSARPSNTRVSKSTAKTPRLTAWGTVRLLKRGEPSTQVNVKESRAQQQGSQVRQTPWGQAQAQAQAQPRHPSKATLVDQRNTQNRKQKQQQQQPVNVKYQKGRKSEGFSLLDMSPMLQNVKNKNSRQNKNNNKDKTHAEGAGTETKAARAANKNKSKSKSKNKSNDEDDKDTDRDTDSKDDGHKPHPPRPKKKPTKMCDFMILYAYRFYTHAGFTLNAILT